MADFAEYLRTTGLPRRQQMLAESEALTSELLQAQKNQSAPQISGGSYSGGGSSGGSSGGSVKGGSYSGPMNLPKLKGGKQIPISAGVSQGWGKSRISYAAGRHTGMDFGAKTGTQIRAAAAGVVTRTGWEGAYGNATHIRHKDGTTSFYAHQSGIGVKAGQTVKAGQAIGAVGSTGRAFGAHLHFEVRKVDKYGGDVNPTSWFSTR